MHAFLIVKTSAIGDVIQTFPVLEYLRARFPKARIDWVVEKNCMQLVQAHPALNHAIEIDTKSWRRAPLNKSTREQIQTFSKAVNSCFYDVVFDLQGNTKSGWVTSMVRAKEKVGYSWKSVPEKLNLLSTTLRFAVAKEGSVRSSYLSLVQKYFQDSEVFLPTKILLRTTEVETRRIDEILTNSKLTGSIWMVCFGSRWPNKQISLSTLKNFLTQVQITYGCSFIFVWGGIEEKAVADGLEEIFTQSVAIGGLSLPQWQALMTRMDGVIAADSAGLHLAGSAGAATFSYFGPSSSAAYAPSGLQHATVQGTCPYGQQFVKRCPKLRTCPTGACLKDLSADALFAAFQTVMQNRYSAPQEQSLH